MNPKRSVFESLQQEFKQEGSQSHKILQTRPQLSKPQFVEGFFLRTLFGYGYDKINTLNQPQKQTILRYMFARNSQIEDEILEYQKSARLRFFVISIHKFRVADLSIKEQIQEKFMLKKINRFQLVHGFSESRDRLGILGQSLNLMFYQLLLGNVFCLPWVLDNPLQTHDAQKDGWMCYNISYFWYLWSHLRLGVVMNWKNCDRFVDKLHPLFVADARAYEKTLRDSAVKIAGQVHEDYMDQAIAELRLNYFYTSDPKVKEQEYSLEKMISNIADSVIKKVI